LTISVVSLPQITVELTLLVHY
jgi:hypothetical protein